MTVRAKLRLTRWVAVKHNEAAPISATLKFDCIYDPSLPEDQRFAKATPSGTIEMQVDNPAALEQFKLGADYYVDFSPVP